MSKRKLEAVDSEPESREGWEDDDEPSSDSDEEDEDGDDDGDVSLGNSEESDLDVDAPRVAQWVDEDDLEQPEVASGDAPHGKAVNTEDIVRAAHVFPMFGWFIVYVALRRKPSKTVRRLTMSFGDHSLSYFPTDLASLPLGALRRAQRALARAQAEENPSDSEEGKGSGSESEPEEVSAKGKESKPNAHKPEWSNEPRTDIAKRGNKNA